MRASKNSDGRGPSTASVHAGAPSRGPGDGLAIGIDRSSTFRVAEEAYRAREAGRSYDNLVYARETAPTIAATEARLAALEGAERALLCASGMAALHAALMALLERGGHVVCSDRIYGGTIGLLRELAPRLGVEVDRFDPGLPLSLESALRSNTALVICESLSNPTLRVAHLPRIAELTHAAGARLLVDATFVTPIFQRPLEQGADLVWHSASKYLGGHSDLIGGVLAGPRTTIEACRHWRTVAGGSADPQMAWLVERGLKTLALRMRAHDSNARDLATWLDAHPSVVKVHHPSRAEPEQRALAAELLRGTGGMLSFEVAGGDEAAARLVANLEVIVEAPSLGGVESIISPPARMSHVGLSPEELRAVGIGPGCLRLSVGVEDLDDLCRDLTIALDCI